MVGVLLEIPFLQPRERQLLHRAHQKAINYHPIKNKIRLRKTGREYSLHLPKLHHKSKRDFGSQKMFFDWNKSLSEAKRGKKGGGRNTTN